MRDGPRLSGTPRWRITVTGVPALRPPDAPLRTDLVLLRLWRVDDLTGLLAAFSDSVVQQFSWPLTTPYGEADARAFLAEQERDRQLGEQIQWALVDPAAPGVLLGGVSLYDVDAQLGQASVGYWLTAPARGRGVATTAVELVAGWAFPGLGLRRLQLTCSPDNIASQRVAERCGFSRQELLPAHLPWRGGWRDSLLYSRPAVSACAAPAGTRG